MRQSGGAMSRNSCYTMARDGGGGGNRTRVLKPRGQSIYARILRFDFREAGLPQAGFRSR